MTTGEPVSLARQFGNDVPVRRSASARQPRVEPTNRLWFTRVFAVYADRLVRRSFHTVRLLGTPELATTNGRPLVLYANHPSWWDPLLAMMLWRRFLGDRIPFAPIESTSLERYGFFKWLGFFGVEKSTARGARAFVQTTDALLRRDTTVLLLTPQGRFADVREGAAGLESGLGHLARRHPDCAFVPLAAEYTHWEERQPEALVRFGPPVVPARSDTPHLSAHGWTRRFEHELDTQMSLLRTASVQRDVAAFNVLSRRGGGVTKPYDLWRSLKARASGRTFRSTHGNK